MRGRAGLLVVLLALSSSACLVDVKEVQDPSAAFAQARAEAGRLQGQRGPARQLNVLAWDPHDHELVRVSVPMWLAKKASEDDHLSLDLDDDEAQLEQRVKRHVKLRDLERAPLGSLLEVEEDDGERVLVWLR